MFAQDGDLSWVEERLGVPICTHVSIFIHMLREGKLYSVVRFFDELVSKRKFDYHFCFLNQTFHVFLFLMFSCFF